MIKPLKCCGGFKMLQAIQPRVPPIMNVIPILTGINHLKNRRRVFIRALRILTNIKVQTFNDSVQYYFLPQGSEKYDDAYYYSPRNDVRERDRLREAGEHQTWSEYSKNNLSAI